MRVQLIGAAALVRLMQDERSAASEQDERSAASDLSWLLFGPTDEAVVDEAAPEPGYPFLLAAE